MGAFPWEFQVFDACGIPVYVHVCLILYFAYDLSSQEAPVKAQAAAQGLPDYRQAGFVALQCSLGFFVLFLTILIHELGHCLGAKIVGGRVQRILLWPLGGLAFCGHGAGPKGELLVALAGPLTHAPQWLAWRALLAMSVGGLAERLGVFGPVLTSLCTSAMSMQVLLTVFNLFVPAYPLDCSKVIISLCCMAGASSENAAIFMCFLSVLCIFTLCASMASFVTIPFIGLGYHPLNLLLGCWMSYQTYQLYCQVKQGSLRGHPLFKEVARPECEPLQASEVPP
jgi:Zn-dependent protease